eukprot:9798369-Lingulodinium_polyedra.AAC.1
MQLPDPTDPCLWRWMKHAPDFKYYPRKWCEEHYGIPFAENSDMKDCGYYLQRACGRRHLKPTRAGHPRCPWCDRELHYL